jgi:pimeloyl-ACP methyl ester carboxylesterase
MIALPAANAAGSMWSAVKADLGLDEDARQTAVVPIGRRRRRAFDADAVDGRATVELVRDDEGILRWIYTPPRLGGGAGRRAYRSIHVAPTDVVERFRFNELGRNEITDRLVGLDQWLTPGQGMKRLQGGVFVDDPHPRVESRRALLLVHGTFSRSEMWLDELQATPQGAALLDRWRHGYEAILAFNHPTLSVGAWSNAIDLQRALRDVTVPVDVVCHSRGGLVVSWLLRLGITPVERVVFVGSPLVGTSLAAPDKLRGALDLLANYAEAVKVVGGAASTVFPLAGGVAGLAKVLGRFLRLGSGLPILDAAIALVPGLATQQAVRNNLDLRQLFADEWVGKPQMWGIGVTFQPDESTQPVWKFWKRFTNVGAQVKYAAADLVFPGANDLVVDVGSMFQLGEGGQIPFEDLGVSATTHHTNYFRDPLVLNHLDNNLA